jgi:hypothetical protein
MFMYSTHITAPAAQPPVPYRNVQCFAESSVWLPHQEADSLVAVLHSMLQLPSSWQPQQRMRQYNGWLASALQDKAVQVRAPAPRLRRQPAAVGTGVIIMPHLGGVPPIPVLARIILGDAYPVGAAAAARQCLHVLANG